MECVVVYFLYVASCCINLFDEPFCPALAAIRTVERFNELHPSVPRTLKFCKVHISVRKRASVNGVGRFLR